MTGLQTLLDWKRSLNNLETPNLPQSKMYVHILVSLIKKYHKLLNNSSVLISVPPVRSGSPLWWFGLWTMVWFSSLSHLRSCSSPGRGELTSVTLQVYLQRLRGSWVLQYNREHLWKEQKKHDGKNISKQKFTAIFEHLKDHKEEMAQY